ncbi:hypothetical protein [Paracoccus sp. SCSIO 75233]|uniref:hypothetical protein n=1 Tax=Paracoccus sp. SCSIO 75233 TaxID=3017782 RepID=UPI0022F0E321|nr:hypothetical protein [Paracoccus sp. SCSIO 75233]WBU52944.1 hypothetical protein PAF12_14145 [Paracoccus sp. SCSIO 75233]
MAFAHDMFVSHFRHVLRSPVYALQNRPPDNPAPMMETLRPIRRMRGILAINLVCQQNGAFSDRVNRIWVGSNAAGQAYHSEKSSDL